MSVRRNTKPRSTATLSVMTASGKSIHATVYENMVVVAVLNVIELPPPLILATNSAGPITAAVNMAQGVDTTLPAALRSAPVTFSTTTPRTAMDETQ